jgi:DNA-binding LytR/AlgR family response regulator
MFLLDFGVISWRALLISVGQVTSLGIILTSIIVSLDYVRHFEANQKEAKEISVHAHNKPKQNNSISLFSDNDKEQLHLKTDELLYLTSADNYIEVVYQSDKKISQKLLRGTLQKSEKQIEYPGIIRCHRSYIVNLHQVVSVDGNAQGYELNLRGLDISIPVSRSYKKAVLDFLKRS